MSETCVCRKLRPLDLVRESLNVFLFLNLVSSLFKSKSRLEAENANPRAGVHPWRSTR